tara:strand:- start:64 stop:342 length:279 start_codon:yes stop_codon:yes gene_type:complete
MEPQIILYYRIRHPPKSSKIKNWKNQGIISDDWDKTYERYIKTLYCEKCSCKLVRQPHPRCRETACIDHDHLITDKENVRNILCMSCNSKRQ